jgi:hypothetical protein
MKMRHRLSLPLVGIALAATTLLPTPAWAWGAQGHRLVARIAETHLDPQAAIEINRLLATEADATLSSIAPWADELRQKDPDLGRRSASWHYVNMAEDGCIYEPPKHCPSGDCVVEALKQQSTLLANADLPDAERLQALKFVVHLVGDIHQPMHAGYGHDKGGNDFQLQYNGRSTNLHSLWDSGILNTRKLGDDAYLRRLRPSLWQRLFGNASRNKDLQPNAIAWAKESCRIAIDTGTYPEKNTIDSTYANKYRPVAEAQLRLAGERLASLLNLLLSPPTPSHATQTITHRHANRMSPR